MMVGEDTNLPVRVHNILSQLQLRARCTGFPSSLFLGLDHLQQLVYFHHPVVLVLNNTKFCQAVRHRHPEIKDDQIEFLIQCWEKEVKESHDILLLQGLHVNVIFFIFFLPSLIVNESVKSKNVLVEINHNLCRHLHSSSCQGKYIFHVLLLSFSQQNEHKSVLPE